MNIIKSILESSKLEVSHNGKKYKIPSNVLELAKKFCLETHSISDIENATEDEQQAFKKSFENYIKSYFESIVPASNPRTSDKQFEKSLVTFKKKDAAKGAIHSYAFQALEKLWGIQRKDLNYFKNASGDDLRAINEKRIKYDLMLFLAYSMLTELEKKKSELERIVKGLASFTSPEVFLKKETQEKIFESIKNKVSVRLESR